MHAAVFRGFMGIDCCEFNITVVGSPERCGAAGSLRNI